jgi:hypothetical protein
VERADEKRSTGSSGTIRSRLRKIKEPFLVSYIADVNCRSQNLAFGVGKEVGYQFDETIQRKREQPNALVSTEKKPEAKEI